jgi:dihydropteroate synthase
MMFLPVRFDEHMFANGSPSASALYHDAHARHPKSMQQNPSYDNVVVDVMRFFSERLAKMRELGVNDVVIDPGFGFGKTLEHNYKLLTNLLILICLNYLFLLAFHVRV